MIDFISKEKAIIGTIIAHPEWYEDVRLHEGLFQDRTNRQIYNIIRRIEGKKQRITYSIVSLEAYNEGGSELITELNACQSSQLFFLNEFTAYCNDLIAERSKQAMNSLGLMLMEMHKDGKTAEYMIDYAQRECNRISDGIFHIGGAMNAVDAYTEYLNNYKRIANKEDNSPYIHTGLTNLDGIFVFKAGLYILAGRPAMGKTAIGLVIAKNVAKQGRQVVIRSLEMDKEQLMERYACSMLTSQADKSDLRMYEYKGNKIYEAPDKLSLQNIWVDDNSATLDDIIADARQMHKEGKCDMLMIDYLSLIRMNRGERRDIEVSDATSKLKLLSKEIKITILLLAQLNRACEARIDKKPMLADLRESGGIEQDADVVMMIYRPKYYEIDIYKTEGGRELTTDGLGVIAVRKNRHGRTGEAYVKFNSDITDCEDWDFGEKPKFAPVPHNYTDSPYYNEKDETILPF